MTDNQPQTTPATPVQPKAPTLPDFVTPATTAAPFDILRNYPGEDKNAWQARYQDIIGRTPSPIYPATIERGYFEKGTPPPDAIDVLSASYQLAASSLAIDSFYKNVVDPNYLSPAGSNYNVDTNKFFSGSALNDLLKTPGGSYVYSQYRSQEYPPQMKSDTFYAAVQHDLERGRLLDTVGKATGFTGWVAQFSGQMLDPGTFLAAVATGGLAEAVLPGAAVAGEAAQGARAATFMRSFAVTEAGAAGAFIPMEAAAQALDPNRQVGQSIEDFGTILGVGAILHTATYAGVRAFIKPAPDAIAAPTPKPTDGPTNPDWSFESASHIIGLSETLKMTPEEIMSHAGPKVAYGPEDFMAHGFDPNSGANAIKQIDALVENQSPESFAQKKLNEIQAQQDVNSTNPKLSSEESVIAAHQVFTDKIDKMLRTFELKSQPSDPLLDRVKELVSDFSVDFTSGDMEPSQAIDNLLNDVEFLKNEFPDATARTRTLVDKVKVYTTQFADNINVSLKGLPPDETVAQWRSGMDIDVNLREAMHEAMMNLLPGQKGQQVVEFEFTPHKGADGETKGYTFEQIGHPDIFGRNPTAKVVWTGNKFEVIDPTTGEPVSAEVKALPIDDLPDPKPVQTTAEHIQTQETQAVQGGLYEPTTGQKVLGHFADAGQQIAMGAHPIGVIKSTFTKVLHTIGGPAAIVLTTVIGSPLIRGVFGGGSRIMSSLIQPGSNYSNFNTNIDATPLKSLAPDERDRLIKGYLDHMGNPSLFKALVNMTALLHDKDQTDKNLNALVEKLSSHYKDGQVIPIEFIQGFNMDALNYIQDKYGSQIDSLIRAEYTKASKVYQMDKQAQQIKVSAALSMAPVIPSLIGIGEIANFAAQNPDTKAQLLGLIPAIEDTMNNPLLGCSDNYAANIDAFVKEVQARSPQSQNLWFAMIDELAAGMQKVGSTQLAGDLDGRGVSYVSGITLGVLGNSLVRVIESAASGDWGKENHDLHIDPVNWMINSAQDKNLDLKIKSRLVTRLENVLNPTEQVHLTGLYMPKEPHDLAVFLAAGEKMSDIARSTRFGNDLTTNDVRFIRGMMPTHDLLAFSNHSREMARVFDRKA